MKRDFDKACNDLARKKRRRREEEDEIDELVRRAEEEVYGKTDTDKKAKGSETTPKQAPPTMQETLFLSLSMSLIPTKTRHCVLDLAKMEHGIIFSFAKALSSNNLIESLEIYTSPMSLATASALAWGIESCQSLKQIKFRFRSSYQEHYGHVLLKAMLENPNINSINMDENLITPAVFETIGSLIIECEKTKLGRLTLEACPIGDRGARILKRIMEYNSSIRYLGIGRNAMSTEAVASLMRHAKKKRYQYLFELSGHGTASEHPEIPQIEEGNPTVTPPAWKPARVSSDEEGKMISPAMPRASPHLSALNHIPRKQNRAVRK
ncbi:MAG: hypothetical protein SGARI_008268, partial [Bacillariaceae sp.]